MARAQPAPIGQRIRRYRSDRGMTLSQLAAKARISKGYLWSLENETTQLRPSGETLYAIAEALGVTMSDLLGRKLLTEPDTDIPAELLEFAEDEGLPESDVQMLARVNFRGERPKTKERWAYIYRAIQMSEAIDREAAIRRGGD